MDLLLVMVKLRCLLKTRGGTNAQAAFFVPKRNVEVEVVAVVIVYFVSQSFLITRRSHL